MAETFLIVRLPLKIGPMDRGDFWKDPLQDKLDDAAGLGEVTGGGTLMDPEGGILCCDLEVAVPDLEAERLDRIEQMLTELGAPKGTRFLRDGQAEPLRTFGAVEVVGIGLDGAGLPDEVYETFDPEEFTMAAEAALQGGGTYGGSFAGPRYTFFYFHGPSADAIETGLRQFASTQPIGEGAQFERLTDTAP